MAALTNFARSEMFTAALDYTAEVLPHKIILTVARLHYLCNANERAVVFVRTALAADILSTQLRLAGIYYVNLCEVSTQFDTFHAIMRFKGTLHCVPVLITSYDVNLVGQTFEDVCNYGIILEYPHRFIDIIDAKNALRPVGSTTSTYWALTHISGTLDTFHRFQLSKQQAEVFDSDASFAPELHGQLRLIAGYEAVRAYMGYQCSDYPRSRVHWSDMDKPEIKKEGEFYSALAQFLMQNPDHSDKVTPRTVQTIALC